MKEKIKQLLKEFYLIQCKGWVKSTGSGKSAAGTTLEHLFGKQEDTLPLPDYLGIELKTKLITSNYNVRLFSAVLDNKPDLMNKLWKLCSWKCTRNGGTRELYDDFNAIDYSNTHRKYAFKMYVNYEKECVELLLYNNWNKKNVNIDMSWSFRELEQRLKIKLSYMALVHAEKFVNKETKEEKFKYLDMTIYKLRSFDVFLKLLEQGIISVNLKMYPFKEPERQDKFRNRETTFCISQENLSLLFEKIDTSDYVIS